MTEETKNSNMYSTRIGVILALLLGLLLVFLINHFSRKGIEGLISSEKKVVDYFELTEKVKQLQNTFFAANIHFHKYLNAGDTHHLTLMEQDLKQADNFLKAFENQNISKNNDTISQEKIEAFSTACKIFLQTYLPASQQAGLPLLAYTNIDVLYNHIAHAANEVESQVKQTILPILEEKRRYGNQVILINMVSFFLTILIVMAAIWLYFKYAEKQKKLQKKLELAKSETEKTALMKDQFLANTSHEIRTPLNAVLGFTNMLKKENLSPKQRELVKGIDYSGNALLGIINNILDFSKLDAGMMPLQISLFSPEDLVKSVVQMFQHQAHQKKIELHLSLGENLPKVVQGDATRLTQVLVNLIGNAIKFTTVGTVEIAILLVKKEDHLCTLGFKITDTGIGISEEQQKTIFERFVQVDSQLTREQGGTGLGLAIVKKVIDLQNGTIRLQSQEGKGSSFYIEIPYLYATENLLEKKSPLSNEVLAFPPDFRLLVVEDNAMNRRIMELLFTDWNIHFDLAEHGKKAIEKAAEQKYDLILMDIQMPEMDGYEATHYLRETLQLEVPIIAMTAHAIAGEVEKCRQAGMDGYLSKPFDEQELLQLIFKFTQHPPPTTQTNSLLDLVYLDNISRGKPERIRELASIFVEQAPKEIAAIEAAIFHKNFTTIKNTAHSMKTTVGFMGLKDSLGSILAKIEVEAEASQQIEPIQYQFVILKKITEQAVSEIRQTFLRAGI